ncbi:MAG: alpha-L-fucosidase [Armatimonadetes bacterium]|nr:alpha-L-fucosidase [Armatimonadota bacterium]
MFARSLLLLTLAALPLLGHAQETKVQKDARMKWWREARFGMFIHWGTYSVLAGEWNGRKTYGEWIREEAHIPLTEYDKVKDRFNPVKFDAEKWVSLAKGAGMRYITITSKHHEGFALFDSKFSDYDVMGTPFKRDIMKELADACARQGVTMCWYHSIMDWHHPDYLPRRSWETGDRPAAGADMDRYCEFLHNQVTELLTRYGKIGVMWFDGEWESTWNHERGQKLYDLCRKLQPNVIVNNRVDVGRGGMGGMSDAGFAGDYGTPEQEIPATGMPGVDWETCMTMNDHWGYCREDKNYKTTRQILRMLSDIASKGGNYLLNVGPTPEGEIPAESVQRLKEIGAWMKVNGDAVYGTHASVFKSLPWGRCTVKTAPTGSTLYLHVFDWPSNGKLMVPGLGNQVVSARLMASKSKLSVSSTVDGVIVSVPKSAPDADVSVVELKVKGAPIVYNAPEILTESAVFVSSGKFKIQTGSKEIQARYTLDGSEPTAKSALYAGAVAVKSSGIVKARGFRNGKAVTPTVAQTFTKIQPLPAQLGARLGDTEPGIKVGVYPGKFESMPKFETLRPEETKKLDLVTLADDPKREFVARLYTGYINAPEDDAYKFWLLSDDGSKLWIDGQLVVDNDGLHSPLEKTGVVGLAKGFHHVRVEWFNASGGAELQLKWAQVGGAPQVVGKSSLLRKTK